MITNDNIILTDKKCDLSTDTDDKPGCDTSFIHLKRFMSHNDEFMYFEVPVTPNSDLFMHPTESPGYNQLNQRLADLYKKFEIEIEPATLNDNKEKTVNVKNTSCSSLMQRRNRSRKNLGLINYL